MVFKRQIATFIPPDRRPHQPGEDRLLSHDTWTYVLCAALGRVTQIDSPLTLYRQHDANMTESDKPMTVRASDHFQDPRPIYLRRARFYQECAVAFDAASRASDQTAQLSTLSRSAARRYSVRASFWLERCEIYGAQRLASRLSAYRAVEKMACDAPELREYLGATQRIKDLANAVFRPRPTADNSIKRLLRRPAEKG